MIRRRTLLSTIVAGSAGAIAGCALLEDEIEEAARPARVSEQVLEETGYEHLRTTESRFEETVDVGDESRDLSITNWSSEYSKSETESGTETAQFQIFTSPTVSVAGRSVNPFQQFDEKRLIRALNDRSERGEGSEIEEVDTEMVEVLGRTVEFTVYRASQEIEDQTVEARLHFASLTNSGELVAILGVHPELLDESANMYRLASGIEHPTAP